MLNDSPRSYFLALAALFLVVMSGGLHPAFADAPGAILVFPRIQVDTTSGIDTVIEIANAANHELNLDCFYEESSDECRPSAFSVALTPNQPVTWKASE